MRIALYIDGGFEQIVLTPETKTETALLGRLTDETRVLTIHQGEFYHCMGGWTRQGSGRSSTILTLTPPDKGSPEKAETDA